MIYGRLMLDVAGLTLTGSEREQLQRNQVGGLILFSRNYKSRIQLIDLIADIRSCNPNMVIAVDQEGGRVQRFKDEFIKLPAMLSLCRCYEIDPVQAKAYAVEMGWLMAAEITAMDIDISFAPVLDIHWAHSKVIGDRAFGKNHSQVSELSGGFMQGMQQAGMCATGKHFPGHGWAAADSHKQIARDEREYAAIEKDDLQPFKTLIEAGLGGIMPAHVIYPKVDPNPAGFSQFWLQQVLRGELGFEGVIFSDDLNMSGATVAHAQDQGQYAARAMHAIEAGCDTVLVCNNSQGAIEVLDYLERENINKSARLAKMRRSDRPFDQERYESAQLIAHTLLDFGNR